MSPTPARAKAAAVKPYELIGRPPVTSHCDSVTSGVTGSVAGVTDVTLAVTGSTTVEVTGYPTSDGRVTIVMSPFRTLVGVLGDDSLLAYDDPKQLFDKRDEIWERIAALTKSWTTRELLDAMLAVRPDPNASAGQGRLTGQAHGHAEELRASDGRYRTSRWAGRALLGDTRGYLKTGSPRRPVLDRDSAGGGSGPDRD